MGQPHPPEPISGPLALYGQGNLGKLAVGYCKTVGQPIEAVFDQSDIFPPEKNELSVAVCVVNEPYVPIESFLLRRFKQVVPFYDLTEKYRHKHPLSNGWFLGDISPNTATVLNWWDDDTSRAHHLQFLAWRRLREEWTFDEYPVFPQNRYFIPEVVSAITCEETFLDIGAHHGEVVETFLKKVSGYYNKIIAIEADPANFKILNSKLPKKDVITLKRVISDTATTRRFTDQLDYMSQLSEHEGVLVHTDVIDDMGINPTFIKVHLEGHELAALKGAERTILDNRPIIAATVYHNDDGVWKTPMWLMETLDNYRVLFRNHGWCGTGAVVYAIPEERCK